MSTQISSIDKFYNSYSERKDINVSKDAEVLSEKLQSTGRVAEAQNAFQQYTGKTKDAAVRTDISSEGQQKCVYFNQLETHFQVGKAYYGTVQGIGDQQEAFGIESLDKWNVFDDYLSNAGYYDGMSEKEINSLRDTMGNILVNTSSSIDFSTGKMGATTSVWSGDGGAETGNELYSYEAQLELESSTAALQYFSNQKLQGSMKEDFDALIDKYYSYTANAISGYQSAEEKLNQSIHDGPQVSDESLRQAGASESSIIDRKVRSYIAGISHSQEEQVYYQKTLRSQLAGMNKDNQKSVIERMQDTMAKYVTGNSDDQDIVNHVKTKSTPLFDHIQKYWTQVYKAFC